MFSAINGSARQSSAPCAGEAAAATPISCGVISRFKRRDSAWHKIAGAIPDGWTPATHMLTWERPIAEFSRTSPFSVSTATRLYAAAACALDQPASRRSAASRSFLSRAICASAAENDL
ncbi:hypothetical protein [Streptomyces celluloflavus]|uniref:hypothetical protein n=1 Tax=Streptomyces celluloflavus TaxID=58344 RepID=UPI0034608C70|nr:hypothetical protein OG717_30340 [Streptomyces celluloflavus]